MRRRPRRRGACPRRTARPRTPPSVRSRAPWPRRATAAAYAAVVSGPTSRPFQPSGTRSAGTIWVGASAAMSSATTTSVGICTRPVSSSRRQVVDHVGLDERVADAPTASDLEGERHRAADEDRVAAVEQRLDHAELVADLRAAEHGDERPRRIVERAATAPRPRARAAAPRRSGALAAVRRSTRATGATRRTPR